MKIHSAASYPIFRLPNSQFNAKPIKAELEKSPPKEFKAGTDRVTYKDIPSKITESNSALKIPDEVVKSDRGLWINEVFKDKKFYDKNISDIQALGYSNNEAKSIIDQAILHSERATDSAIAHESLAGLATYAVMLATGLGILRVPLNHYSESTPGYLKHTVDALYGGAAALRGYLQYQLYCGRPDDDGAKNRYEAEKYGNLTSGIFSDLAYIFETTINPIPLVLLGFTSEKTQGIIRPLLSLPSSDWWRIRMLSDINQQFGTDLFSFLLHKPLSLLEVANSVKKIREIKERGNLNYSYISKRLIELIGLDSTKNKFSDVFPELGKLLKNLFSNNKEFAKDSSLKIGKFFASMFGLYGLAAYSIGIPLKSILRFFDIESKFINAFNQSGAVSQQLLYIFRIFLPEQFENQAQEYDENNPGLNKLKTEKNRLFYTGVASCSANILSTVFKFVNPENEYLKMGLGIFNELADKGINYNFSRRRQLIGKKHRLRNPELYNPDGTAKIISDKVKIEDEKELAAKAA